MIVNNSEFARRTEIVVKIDGVDVSADINKYLLSMTYTDHEEDKADDLRIEVDDREGRWLVWLKEKPSSAQTVSTDEFKMGDVVEFKGGHHYVSSVATVSANHTPRTAGTAKVTHIAKGALHPIHLIGITSNVYGWVDEQLIGDVEQTTAHSNNSDIKGLTLSSIIIQKNWHGNGKDSVLDCGVFEIDGFDVSGGGRQGAKVALKAVSLPHSSTVNTVKKTRAWENIKLSAIAGEIANKNNLECMFLSAYDPLYSRREQIQTSDIVFLQRLCKNAGIALKATAKKIVLFDEADFERKAAVYNIKRGAADVKSYRFGTSSNDTKYSKCHVSYTDPQSGQTIEYTYTPRDSEEDGQTLEINEKVNSRDEARQLAMKRLRQKNKAEFSAEFTLVGNVGLVAGVTVAVSGWGVFDGKYIIETATHSVTGSGYTLQLKLRRVLTVDSL